MKQLIEDLISAMEYHVEQTRPIHSTTVALQAAREALKAMPTPLACDCNQGQVCHVCDPITPPAQPAPVQQTCNCRWDGEVQVQQCTLHQAHVDAIHEWAERAKAAEAKLKAQPAHVQPVACSESINKALMDAAPLLYQGGYKAESAACNAALLMLMAAQPPAAQPAPDLQVELDATNRQVEILSDALAESRRELAALKANAALDKMAENARELGLDYEPVAFEVGLVEWVGNKLMATPKTTTTAPASWMEMVTANLVREGVSKHKARELAEHFYGLAQPAHVQEPDAFDDDIEVTGPTTIRTRYRLEVGTKLYTTPPVAQRQWVGVTLTDREKLRERYGWNYPALLVDAVSDILKEKNNG